MFTKTEILPGVWHIQDAMGVCFTLLKGRVKCLLVDTGYGLENPREAVAPLTEELPCQVVLTHGHHDHVLGARWFETTWMHPADRAEFHLRTGAAQRTSVAAQAAEKGIPVPADYGSAVIPEPLVLELPERRGSFDGLEIDLGGMRVILLHVPGHTPGSLVIHVPERNLLLTGDDWNPCTWLWFPSSLPVKAWRENMEALMRETHPEHVLCSHQPNPRSGKEVQHYLAYLTDERLAGAEDIDMGSPIHTGVLTWGNGADTLVFDVDKA